MAALLKMAAIFKMAAIYQCLHMALNINLKSVSFIMFIKKTDYLSFETFL
jgi:hypothetical protein